MLSRVDTANRSQPSTAPFGILQRELDKRASVISVEGDLDLSTAPRLKWMLIETLEAGHSELVVEPEAFFAQWPLAVLRRGAPVSESSDIPILLLSQAASPVVKMVLTGEGSDELLGGYPKHRAERWIGLYQQLIPQFLHEQVVAPFVGRLP